MLTACMLVRHTTSPFSMLSVPIHSIPAWQNYESDSLSKSFDVKTVYIYIMPVITVHIIFACVVLY